MWKVLAEQEMFFLHALCDYAAIAIDNARAVEKIQELYHHGRLRQASITHAIYIKHWKLRFTAPHALAMNSA